MFSTTKILEQKRTILMGLLIMLTVIGYNILRGMKKAVILTFPSAGAAYIPFVKTTLVMPMSILIGALYLYVRHKRGIITAYYAVTAMFLFYFVLFTFYLLPNITSVTPDAVWLSECQKQLPHFKFFIGMLSNWPIAMYYVAAELWGTYSLVVLFWQIANELYTPAEATDCFPTFIFVSSVSIIIASYIIEGLSLTNDPLTTCTLTICSLGAAMTLIVFTLNHYYHDRFINSHLSSHVPAKKKKISFSDSLSLTFSSPHVLYIGICVFSFGMLVNFFELSLDHKISQYYSNPKLLLEFQSWFTRTKGILCILANVVNAVMLRRMGWFAVAMITPCICILSANIFLFSCYHIDFLQSLMPAGSAEEILVWTGCILLVVTYSCKYSFFDTTKELAFTPLPDSMKANAKAVADGICGRAGKSGSSFVQASLISITAAQTVPDIVPYLMYLGAFLSVFWVWSMTRLNHSYQAKMALINATDPIDTDSADATSPQHDQISSPLEASTT
tara:strand:- start:4299 stop:5807 length:1509 start_codon:yes stop_codon:yes gene_type:complete